MLVYHNNNKQTGHAYDARRTLYLSPSSTERAIQDTTSD